MSRVRYPKLLYRPPDTIRQPVLEEVVVVGVSVDPAADGERSAEEGCVGGEENVAGGIFTEQQCSVGRAW